MKLKNKRHICYCAAACIFGILAYTRPKGIWPALCILLLAGIIIAVKEYKRPAAVGFFLAAAASLFFVNCAYQEHEYQAAVSRVSSGSEVVITGVVYRKEQKEKTCLYYLKKTYFQNQTTVSKGGKVLIYYQNDGIPIGSSIQVSGKAETFPHAANEGNFDAADYYRSQNITFRLFAESMRQIKEPYFPGREWLYRFQKQMIFVFTNNLNERDAGILCTLAAGSRQWLDEETKQLYQSSGAAHILAISGVHISFLGLGIFRILRKFRRSYWFSAALGSAAVFGFVAMSGFGTSAVRALLMYFVLAGAQVLGRAYDPVNSLSLAAVLILFHNPMALFQSGFLFSFTSMIAIFGTAAILPKRKKTKKKKARKFMESFAVGGAVQLWILPLTAWFYFEIPVYALFLNQLILPLCGCLLGFGIAGGIAGTVVLSLSKWLFVIPHFILEWYDLAMRAAGRFPGNLLLTGRPPAGLLVLYYAALSALYVYLYRRKFNFKCFPVVPPALFLILILHCPNFPPGFPDGFGVNLPRKEEFRVDFLDVGQGDGICISDGAGHTVFVDGGSADENEVGRYRILPFLKYHRIKKIDAWIVTHADEDHISGLLEILKTGYPVKRLLLAKAMPEDEAWEQLVEAAEEADTEITYVNAKDRLALSGADMECLYPDISEINTEDGGKEDSEINTRDGGKRADRNGLSQVWKLKKGGCTILLTGDIGEEQETLLMERGMTERADILKAAHHGSKNSSGADFLREISPKLTVISCGENNRYGHPHPEAVERISAAGSQICSTAEKGQITVREKDDKAFVSFPMEKN